MEGSAIFTEEIPKGVRKEARVVMNKAVLLFTAGSTSVAFLSWCVLIQVTKYGSLSMKVGSLIIEERGKKGGSDERHCHSFLRPVHYRGENALKKFGDLVRSTGSLFRRPRVNASGSGRMCRETNYDPAWFMVSLPWRGGSLKVFGA